MVAALKEGSFEGVVHEDGIEPPIRHHIVHNPAAVYVGWLFNYR